MRIESKFNIGDKVLVDGRPYYEYIVNQICYNGDSIDYQVSFTDNGPNIMQFWVGESCLSCAVNFPPL